MAPSPAAPYGMCGGGGARKRKDVVHYQEEEEEEEVAAVQGARLGGEGHGLFVLETVEEEEEEREAEAAAEAENERSSIGPVSEGDEEEGGEVESARETPWQRRTKRTGGLASLDALDDALPIK